MQLCVGCVVSCRLLISLQRDEKIDGNNMRGITVVEGKFEKKIIGKCVSRDCMESH